MTTAYRLAHQVALARNPDPFRPAQSDNRWNSRDAQVAYAAESLALAALELLTYWGHYPNLRGYRLFSITFKATDSEDLLKHRPGLDPSDYTQTRPYGNRWVQEGRSLALKAPSVVVPLSSNYLINPNHPRFAIATVTSHGAFTYDERIARLVEQAKAARGFLKLSPGIGLCFDHDPCCSFQISLYACNPMTRSTASRGGKRH